MKKLVLSFIFMLALTSLFGQEEEDEPTKIDTLNGFWSHSGDFALNINQVAFNADWQDGGTSKYAGEVKLNYDMDYLKKRLSWDNNIRMEYGLTKNKGERYLRKSNDRLQLTSIGGYRVAEGSKWYYSFLVDFKTQFANGYEYGKDDNGRTIREKTSQFLSPGYLKFGPGMRYRDDELLKINIAPATSRFIFVNDEFTTVPGYEDEDYYGVDAGKSMRYEFGGSVDISSKFELVENVDVKNKLSLFSDYLDKPGNVDIDYTLDLEMQINEFLSANFVFQAIYEDNAVGAFQIREGLGIGLSYKLN